MSQTSSKFWTFVGLPASLVLLASAYYIKVPTARTWFDSWTPLPHQWLGRFVSSVQPAAGAVTTTPGTEDGSPANLPPSDGTNAAPPPPAEAAPAPVTYDLQTLARDNSLWPRQVRLKKATSFPAVVDGKAVGSLMVPTGTEVNLRAIREGKLGLEYKGGGTWLAVEDTDLASRVPLR
jgi:hypothetical protein